MKLLPHICYLLIATLTTNAQTIAFKENSKWGIKDPSVIIVPAVYDTAFNFDATGQLCLACFRIKTATANKFMRVLATSYACNYLDKKNKRLVIRNGKDTCSVFSLGKNTLSEYQGDGPYFVANVKGSEHLLTKDFKQLTSRGYHYIAPSGVAGFYITREMAESEILFTGLINAKEEIVVPYQYSSISINPLDSIIIACSAGVRPNADDDLYDYSGKKTGSYSRHIEMATKNFVIHKLYEPKEHYVLFNKNTLEEKILYADEVRPSLNDSLLVRIKHSWYEYDLKTNNRKPKQS